MARGKGQGSRGKVQSSKIKPSNSTILEKAKKVKLLLLDVDGVMTDGRIFLDSHGNEIKSFHTLDGQGIKLLQKAGIIVAIVSGRSSNVVSFRAKELNISEVYQGVSKKKEIYDHLLQKFHLKNDEVAFIGDDLMDLPVLRRAGLPITVADASEEVKNAVDLITERGGGKGAVREVADLLLRAQGRWAELTKFYYE